MDTTVVVAGMGFTATVLGAWLTARSQRTTDREGRILEAKVHVYGECSDTLYEYVRAMFNRVRARFDGVPDGERHGLRQEAYRCGARARSAIGQAAIVSGNEDVQKRLEMAREAVGELKEAVSHPDLINRHEDVLEKLNHALDTARADLIAMR